MNDLDFADDIVLLHESWEGMQDMTQSLEEEGRKIGLVLNAVITKIMAVRK